MKAKYYSVSIDVSKIEKKRLFKGKKGNYLNCFIAIDEKTNEYGNIGFLSQSITKEERQSGVKSVILGNLKPIVSKAEKDDLPF